ncbi:MAG: cell division protein SepF [Candidatus Micrarchaeia archaeon]
MGVFDKLSQAFGVSSSKSIDIGEYMNSAEMEDVDVLHEPADMYVKPVTIVSEDEIKLVEDELSKKNIILLNIAELEKRPTTRSNVISALKAYAASINGDIAQIDDTRILLTPAKVKIIKRRKAENQ